MSIEYYVGNEGPCFKIESKQELCEALDILHTQVIENIGEDSKYLAVLERAEEEIDNLQ